MNRSDVPKKRSDVPKKWAGPAAARRRPMTGSAGGAPRG